jgi:hypothetical protein
VQFQDTTAVVKSGDMPVGVNTVLQDANENGLMDSDVDGRGLQLVVTGVINVRGYAIFITE